MSLLCISHNHGQCQMHNASRHCAYMTTPADRLIEARKRKYGDESGAATRAAEALGEPAPTYYGHENGSRGFTRKARKYARHFGVSYEWLMTGTGAMLGDPVRQLYEQLEPEAQAEAFRYMEYLKQKRP